MNWLTEKRGNRELFYINVAFAFLFIALSALSASA
jgi:hypothetical protein